MFKVRSVEMEGIIQYEVYRLNDEKVPDCEWNRRSVGTWRSRQEAERVAMENNRLIGSRTAAGGRKNEKVRKMRSCS